MEPETSPVAKESPLENKELSRPNVYPSLRRTLFVLIVLFFLVVMVFLVYQNGKSIYDNGI